VLKWFGALGESDGSGRTCSGGAAAGIGDATGRDIAGRYAACQFSSAISFSAFASPR